jgi:hypothetical protein
VDGDMISTDNMCTWKLITIIKTLAVDVLYFKVPKQSQLVSRYLTSGVHLEKLTVTQLVKKFPAFYETLKFITFFTRATTGPYREQDESIPHLPTLFA